jgi:His Kinase A (phosphoacceptor) domain./Histidine kinase-, DNA gyrase B-, and HSP90-like ATPase.
VLAREQKLHALDGLAAAAAHELGTPLSTIVVITSELAKQLPKDNPYADDISLLKSQAQRCREILQKLTQHPEEQDPLVARIPVEEMLKDAAAPYRKGGTTIFVSAQPLAETEPEEQAEPLGVRRPGVIYGLGNIIENAANYAASEVHIGAEWGGGLVIVTIADDGPGFRPEVIDNLGEPYVTTRAASPRKRDGEAAGLGLGFSLPRLCWSGRGQAGAREPPATRARCNRACDLAEADLRGGDRATRPRRVSPCGARARDIGGPASLTEHITQRLGGNGVRQLAT